MPALCQEDHLQKRQYASLDGRFLLVFQLTTCRQIMLPGSISSPAPACSQHRLFNHSSEARSCVSRLKSQLQMTPASACQQTPPTTVRSASMLPMSHYMMHSNNNQRFCDSESSTSSSATPVRCTSSIDSTAARPQRSHSKHTCAESSSYLTKVNPLPALK